MRVEARSAQECKTSFILLDTALDAYVLGFNEGFARQPPKC